MEGIKQTAQVFPVVPRDRTRGHGQKLLEVPSEYQETLFLQWGWPAEMLHSLPPWWCAEAVWTWLWTACPRLMLFALEGSIRWPLFQAHPCCNSGILWCTVHWLNCDTINLIQLFNRITPILLLTVPYRVNMFMNLGSENLGTLYRLQPLLQYWTFTYIFRTYFTKYSFEFCPALYLL